MRLDKYLKVSRLIKRRTVAKEIADQGRISINGKVAKSSSDVSTNDELEVRFGNKTLTVKVAKIVETTKKEASADMYEIVSETFSQDFRETSDEK
ncbi:MULTISPECIES: RNA-binding S4 domain-containing protein [Leuconostoc]|jgi:ribosomal 50S subunit-recycling heat shock protein|uniref:RQC P-site tRNA stabilizing factor n=3 Tax=Leuconostoc TaxID=1243 RepID=A0AAN2QW85_9LACO|nr:MULTISPECIES: RNA-binding S4 domain-containing protein [Leuconostoc]MBR2276615.1 RNA-binding S4 domain-containing protein [Leuconostoc sp.]AFS39867.1 heat shock protein 15 [Leuconostoc gelidum JB7]MBZ5945630.1 RNA-binding S4 domain-containing protein [Leuconostoc gasicomitatum]MBZ5947554.1 RNA-binding S4 domain-containing protein [Leuconostoc gasicomitatum]MBZ5953918.1 RNA-binding S4 domain-containing protein [Leuconostoc gasicomitatum]